MVGYWRQRDLYAIYGAAVAVTPVPDQTSPACRTGEADGRGCTRRTRRAGPGQPLTEPSVRPPRQKRCSTRMRIASGITDSSAPPVVSW